MQGQPESRLTHLFGFRKMQRFLHESRHGRLILAGAHQHTGMKLIGMGRAVLLGRRRTESS